MAIFALRRQCADVWVQLSEILLCASYPLIDWLCMAELTKEQIACEEKFLEDVPRWNIGALFLPPVWGPAHGFWATILFYPLWLVADNLFYAAYSERTPLAIAFAVIIGLVLVAVTFLFSRLSQPFAGASCGSSRRFQGNVRSS